MKKKDFKIAYRLAILADLRELIKLRVKPLRRALTSRKCAS